jgi:hypothetical protein
MKVSKSIAIILLVVWIFSSCENNGIKPSYTYLEQYKKIYSYSKSQMEMILGLAAIQVPEIGSLNIDISYDVDVYRVTYRTHLNQKEITASGLVCIPVGDSAFSFLSFQNGTNTCLSNAPSKRLDNQLYSFISILAGGGYIAIIPDYIGFGESASVMHPYMHRESSNNAVIDLLQATRELINARLVSATYNGQVYLMGYSQGGWATLSVLDQLEHSPEPDLHVVAAACGAGAYDLKAMAQYILSQDEYPTTFFMPYFIESRLTNGLMSGELPTYFNEPYAAEIPQLLDGSLCNTALNMKFPKKVNELMQQDFLDNFLTGSSFSALRQELESNSVSSWGVQAKLRFYHSTGDKTIPYIQSKDIYSDFESQGLPEGQVTLFLNRNDTLGHNDVIIPWGVDAINWINTVNSR